MFSIGQFSKACQVSIKTLHYYDKIGLMRPCCIDEFTGYRYYHERQISEMLLIQRFKRYGFSLSEIKDLLSCSDKKALFSKFEEHKLLLKKQIEDSSLILEEMNRHLDNFERTGNIMNYQERYRVELKNTEDLLLRSSRQMMSVNDFGKYYGLLFEQMSKEHIAPSGVTLAIYHDEEFNPECNDIEVAVTVSEESQATRKLPGGLCATTLHRGSYSSLGDSYGAVVRWIETNGYEMTGSPYEIYLKNQFDNLPADQWETQVFFPVRKN